MPTVMPVYGTRPEAIKMAPVVAGLQEVADLEVAVVVTGQHRSMLDQVNRAFGIIPAHDLDIFQPGQGLERITTQTISGLTDVLAHVRPDAVVVQGDTTSAFAAALAAFYRHIPVVHVEAGLRTRDRWLPFPEEMNRRLVGCLASLHLAPTATSRSNLLREGVASEDIVVTGNTVIDALLEMSRRPLADSSPSRTILADPRRMVLVTAHRRESWGESMRQIGLAVATLADREPDTLFVLPLHANPEVRQPLAELLRTRANVLITEPQPYDEFAHLMRRASVILTDSGGIQEEAPSLGVPVLVMRESTERPEAVTAGTVRLVGTDSDRIVAGVSELLHDPEVHARMARAVNPYGDGRAGRRSAAAIAALLGVGSRMAEFVPGSDPRPAHV